MFMTISEYEPKAEGTYYTSTVKGTLLKSNPSERAEFSQEHLS
jgi:hypothetical protein